MIISRTENQIIIIAESGKYITNGIEIYRGIAMPLESNTEEWYEITEEEKTKIEEKLENNY